MTYEEALTMDVRAYSGLLEEATGFTCEVGTDDDGELCYWLVDLCGEHEGDPWYEWQDLISDTVDTVVEQLAWLQS